MTSSVTTLKRKSEPELFRCAIISNAHMTRQDSDILDSLSHHISGEESGYNWIHPTTSGFLIRVSARTDAAEQLSEEGLSDDFCRVITFLTEKSHVAMIQFDADAELLEGFNVHNW